MPSRALAKVRIDVETPLTRGKYTSDNMRMSIPDTLEVPCDSQLSVGRLDKRSSSIRHLLATAATCMPTRLPKTGSPRMHYAIVSETYPPEVNGVALTVQALEHGLRA